MLVAPRRGATDGSCAPSGCGNVFMVSNLHPRVQRGRRAVMKVLFVWPGLTGYMGDCWRELSRCDGIELKVVVDLEERTHGNGFAASDVMRGLDWHAHRRISKIPCLWRAVSRLFPISMLLPSTPLPFMSGLGLSAIIFR